MCFALSKRTVYPSCEPVVYVLFPLEESGVTGNHIFLEGLVGCMDAGELERMSGGGGVRC